MRAIKAAMAAENFKDIPIQIRAMKRLWPLGTSGHADLTARREHEAVLFEKALAATTPALKPLPEVVTPLPQPVLVPEHVPVVTTPFLSTTMPHNVAWVQRALNEVMNAGLVVDDAEGPETRRAVAKFQTLHELSVDNMAGPETIAALVVCLRRLGK